MSQLCALCNGIIKPSKAHSVSLRHLPVPLPKNNCFREWFITAIKLLAVSPGHWTSQALDTCWTDRLTAPADGKPEVTFQGLSCLTTAKLLWLSVSGWAGRVSCGFPASTTYNSPRGHLDTCPGELSLLNASRQATAEPHGAVQLVCQSSLLGFRRAAEEPGATSGAFRDWVHPQGTLISTPNAIWYYLSLPLLLCANHKNVEKHSDPQPVAWEAGLESFNTNWSYPLHRPRGLL